MTYRRSLEADYNQPDIWDLEKAMEAKIKDNGGGCVRSLKK